MINIFIDLENVLVYDGIKMYPKKEEVMSKQGVILACFGSIYREALSKSVDVMKAKIEERYPDSTVETVFLSEAVIAKWREKYESPILSLDEALDKMANEGVDEVYVQPFYFVADQSYQQMRSKVMKMIHEKRRTFTHLNVGKPLLNSLGVKNHADDYALTIAGILKHVKEVSSNKTILLMGNGQSQLEYATLQLKCLYGLADNVVVFTSNGFPNFKEALNLLEAKGKKEILLVPLVLIGSEHLMDYLAGNRSDSVKSLLEEEGYEVSVWNEGLGENPFIHAQFMKHLDQAIRVIERKKMGYGTGCSLNKK